jgi:PPP family 3-phenylpropionic acid transporter
VIAATAAVAGYVMLALAGGTAAIVIMFVLASTANTPVILLADAYALRGLSARGRAYGTVRLWGSAAFVLASFAAGFLFDQIAAANLIWLVVGAVALTAVAAWLLAPVGSDGVAPTFAATKSPLVLLRTPGWLAVAVAASAVQASHAVYYGFSTIAWQAQGLDGLAIGALWSLGVVAEIGLFAMSGRLPAAVTPTLLIVIGAGGALVRWAAMACDPPAGVLPALQCLHGLSFGATHLGALGFVARTAPPGLGATAQAYLAVALGAAMAAAMGAAGVLYGRYGALAYSAMALMALAGGLSALVAHLKASR